MALIRAAMVAFALVAAAWFALAATEARDVDQVTALVAKSTPLGPPTRAALDQLSSAGTLNPDRHVDVLRATLLAQSGQSRRAVTLLQRVVRTEPMNLDAWYALAKFGGGDKSLEASALQHILQLDPILRPRS